MSKIFACDYDGMYIAEPHIASTRGPLYYIHESMDRHKRGTVLHVAIRRIKQDIQKMSPSVTDTDRNA